MKVMFDYSENFKNMIEFMNMEQADAVPGLFDKCVQKIMETGEDLKGKTVKIDCEKFQRFYDVFFKMRMAAYIHGATIVFEIDELKASGKINYRSDGLCILSKEKDCLYDALKAAIEICESMTVEQKDSAIEWAFTTLLT